MSADLIDGNIAVRKMAMEFASRFVPAGGDGLLELAKKIEHFLLTGEISEGNV